MDSTPNQNNKVANNNEAKRLQIYALNWRFFLHLRTLKEQICKVILYRKLIKREQSEVIILQKHILKQNCHMR